MKFTITFLLSFMFILNIFSAPIEITILFTNDVNGRPLAFSYNQEDNMGGIPARGNVPLRVQQDNGTDVLPAQKERCPRGALDLGRRRTTAACSGENHRCREAPRQHQRHSG